MRQIRNILYKQIIIYITTIYAMIKSSIYDLEIVKKSTTAIFLLKTSKNKFFICFLAGYNILYKCG
jgi:hypothetical protein